MKNFFKGLFGKSNDNNSSSEQDLFTDATQENEISEFDDEAFIDGVKLSVSSLPMASFK